MTLRNKALAAMAAFGFAFSFVASAQIPLGPCQICRADYNKCMNNPNIDDTVCEGNFSVCLIGAGCPLE